MLGTFSGWPLGETPCPGCKVSRSCGTPLTPNGSGERQGSAGQGCAGACPGAGAAAEGAAAPAGAGALGAAALGAAADGAAPARAC